jgi:hypothetical protein
MAKQKSQKEIKQPAKGQGKSARWSETTKANKARRAEARARRLRKRAERRDYVCLVVRANDGEYRRMSGMARTMMRSRAELFEIQREQIRDKRETRQRLAKMSAKERRAAREAGQKQFHNPLLTSN